MASKPCNTKSKHSRVRQSPLRQNRYKKLYETVNASGHVNVRATHRSTFEITKERALNEAGNCIIAVSADKSLLDLSRNFKIRLVRKDARLTIQIRAGGISDTVHAFGSPKLALSHPTDMVVRKSSYVCNRTLAIKSDKAAFDLSRELIENLKKPFIKSEILLTLEA